MQIALKKCMLTKLKQLKLMENPIDFSTLTLYNGNILYILEYNIIILEVIFNEKSI